MSRERCLEPPIHYVSVVLEGTVCSVLIKGCDQMQMQTLDLMSKQLSWKAMISALTLKEKPKTPQNKNLIFLFIYYLTVFVYVCVCMCSRTYVCVVGVQRTAYVNRFSLSVM